MAAKRLKRPRDPVSLAKLIGDIATGQVVDAVDGKDPVAVALGRIGGLKGGSAREEDEPPCKVSLSAEGRANYINGAFSSSRNDTTRNSSNIF